MKKLLISSLIAILIIVITTMQALATLPFKDVASGDWYYEAVRWAVDKYITTGTSADTFSPKMLCDRAQAVTFLWRAVGSPEPSSSEMIFSDVSADAYYAKAVLWAVEENITTGTGNGKFSPDMKCDRAQIVTFLWRTVGSPTVESTNPFMDVSVDSYYISPVLWAVKENVTTGTGGSSFSPSMSCDRSQIVTFLYRCFKRDITFLSQPADFTCYEGEEITFTAEANGYFDINYIWQSENTDGQFTDLSDSAWATGCTTNTLKITVTSEHIASGLKLRCVAYDKFGNTATSVTASVLPGEPLAVATQPDDKRAGFDANVDFNVAVTGGRAPYNYKWEIYTSTSGAYVPVESGPLYSGVNAEKLTVVVTKGCSEISTKFRCIITDAAGNSITTNEALLLESLYVAVNPVNGNTVDIFSEQTLNVDAKGGVGKLTYQWQVKADYMSDWEDIVTYGGYQDFYTPTLKLTITSDEVRYNQQYRCMISDESGDTVYSAIASFNVIYPELKLVKNPLDAYCKADGMVVEFTVEAIDGMVIQGGNSLYEYSWQYSVNGSSEWKPLSGSGISWVSGEDSDTLTVTGVPEAFTSSYLFRCVVTDAVGDSVTSYEAMLIPYKPMSFSSYETPYFASPNEELTIQIFVDGGIPEYSYEWYFRIDGMPVFAEITSSDVWADAGNKNYITLNLPKDMLEANLRIYMLATDRQGEWIMTDVITIKPELSVSAEATEVYTVLGDVNTVKVNVIGGQAPYTYKWSIYNKDGTYVNLAASTSSNTYSSKMFEYNVTFRDTKDYYICTVTDALGKTVTSENIYLKEMIPFDIVTHPYSDELYRVGDSDRFFIEVEGGVGPYTYKWEEKLNYQTYFTEISGATTDKLDYTFTENHRKYAVTIRCTVTDSLGNTVTSNEFTPKFALWIDESDTTYTVSNGTQRILFYNIKGGVAPYTFKWYVYDVDTGLSTDPSNINYSGITVNGNNLTVKVTAHVAEHYKFYCEVSDASGDLIISPMKSFKVNSVGFKNDLASRYYVDKTGDRVYLKVELNDYATTPVRYVIEYSDDTYTAGYWSTKKIATGEGLSYEISYLIGTSERDNHARYRIIATDSNGNSVTSNVMSVVFSPRIESYTVSRDFNVGTSTTFTVNVTDGTAPYTYKWQYSTTAEGGYIDCISSSEPFTGENTATLTIGNITSSMENYTFRCVITDAEGGTVTSNPAVFIVRPIMITSQPQSVVAEKGTTFTFKGLKATGGKGALKYQWQIAYTTTPTSDSDFFNCFLAPAYFSNYDTNELSVFYNTGFENSTFRCKITDADGNVVYSDYVYVTQA